MGVKKSAELFTCLLHNQLTCITISVKPIVRKNYLSVMCVVRDLHKPSMNGISKYYIG